MATHHPRIALIHALAHAVDPINEAIARDWPEATRMNLLDDSLSADLAASGRGQDALMQARFQRLAQYAVDCGSDAILFTCSAFGACIEAVAATHSAIPVLKPNEAMIDDAAALDQRIGLVATFGPTLISMPPEFPQHVVLDTALADGALAALNAGDGALHDELIAQSAAELEAKGCRVIALAQFSMARAATLVHSRTGLVVITPVSSAVSKLKFMLGRLDKKS
jgi:aspartate/glutamate racemase